MADLSKLSPAEREALRMLGDGHTAKSAAALLGISTGAFNERLRAARGKTGAGSSRELARWVRSDGAPNNSAQENRDGAAVDIQAGKTSMPMLTLSVGFTRGALVMTVAAIAAAALGGALLVGAAARPAQPPHVVSTSPQAGAVVPNGPVTLTVTFDRPMKPGGYSFTMRSPETFPHCASPPTQSADARTYSIRCALEPQHAYEVGFNSANHRNFAAADDGAPAVPQTLRFSTR